MIVVIEKYPIVTLYQLTIKTRGRDVSKYFVLNQNNGRANEVTENLMKWNRETTLKIPA